MGIYTSGDVPQKGKYKREPLRKPLSSHVDYGTLFPDDILASNIDFLIERNGEFLVIEFKQPYERLSRGQQILLNNMSRMPEFTVLLVVPHAEAKQFPKMNVVAKNNAELIEFIRNWKHIRGL